MIAGARLRPTDLSERRHRLHRRQPGLATLHAGLACHLAAGRWCAPPPCDSSHRTTERAATNGHDAIDAELGELLHHQLGLGPLDQGERHADLGLGSGLELHLAGRFRGGPEASRAPVAGTVADDHGIAVTHPAHSSEVVVVGIVEQRRLHIGHVGEREGAHGI